MLFAAILATIFAAISNAISNRPCKLLAIQIAVKSQQKSPLKSQQKVASVNGPYGDETSFGLVGHRVRHRNLHCELSLVKMS